jgi:hypothetical protein
VCFYLVFGMLRVVAWVSLVSMVLILEYRVVMRSTRGLNDRKAVSAWNDNLIALKTPRGECES